MILLTVDGVNFTGITKYDYKMADIDSANSGRSESGLMMREVVRRKLVSIQVGFDNIHSTQHQSIMAALNKDFVSVTFYDGTATRKSATMYCSEIDFSLVSSAEDLWNVSFQLTEQ